jgi:DNA-binding NtrC family response regulator
MSTILVVDDDTAARRLLYHVLKDEHRVVEAGSREAALESMRRDRADLVLLDLHLPPRTDTADEGIRLHRELHELAPGVPLVIVTGDQDRGLALNMVRRGVADFRVKPIDPAELKIVIARALERARLEEELEALRRQRRERCSFGGLIGQSRAMRELFAKLERVADASQTVLLLGETGTGKSAVARAIHYESRRAAGPFVVLDGATVPESLVESELFGHVRGAYTGAEAPRTGRARLADGGTLFLDEVGNLSPAVQAKLLLFLDTRSFAPVGTNDEIHVDVRVLAATNRNLDRLVREGRFREDLLYRLQVVTVDLPPLRDRPEDIAPLVDYLLGTIAESRRG